MTPLIVLIVTFGLAFVIFAALAAGLTVTFRSVAAPLKGRARPTIGVLIANFVVVPVLTWLTLQAFDFAAQATMAFALLSVVAGAPFVAMFTRLGRGDVAYAASISLILMLVTVPFVPLVLPWLLTVLHVSHTSVTTWHLLKPLLWFFLLPLVIGLAVRWRYPNLAKKLAPHFSQVALVSIALHITLMYVAYRNDVVAELHTGEYLYSVLMPIGCLIVGYAVCWLFMPRAAGTAGRGIRLPAALGTAQRGSQALICSLIFAMGTYPVAGVVALGSSVITVFVLVILSAEIGKRHDRRLHRTDTPVAEADVVPAPRLGQPGQDSDNAPEVTQSPAI
jgi:bile acid:Na+ symporter, BASS family